MPDSPTPNPATDPRAWWENLIDLHPPKSPQVATAMDITRARFRRLGLELISLLPPGPDLTGALRSLKDASQHAIACIACNQDHWPDQ